MGLSLSLIATILLTWALITPGLIAIGRLIFRDASYPDAFLAGFALATALLIAYHFVAAINQIPFAAVGLIGLVWLALNGRKLKRSWAYLLIGLLIVVLTAIFASRYAPDADDGLYHIPLTQWFAAYPVVPGLANLHTRFGFDNSYFAFAAMFEWLPGGALHYATGLIWLATLAFLARSRFGKLLIFPLCLWFGYVSTLQTDFIILCLTLVLGCTLFELIDGQPINLKWFALLVFFGVTVKLSFAVFGAASLALAIYLSRASLRALIPTFVGGAALVIVWMLHGVVISGYPLYPLTLGAASVDWRLPVAEAQMEYTWIWSWARIPGVTPDQVPPDWFGAWLVNSLKNFDTILFVCFSLPTLPLLLKHRPKLLFFPPIVAGLIYWFITAPDIRFAAGLLWLTSGALVYAILPQAHGRLINGVLIVLCFLVAFLYIQPLQGTPETANAYDVDGYPVYVALLPDQLCLDHPLPCAAYLTAVEQLEWRKPGDLANGFRSLLQPRTLQLYDSGQSPGS